MKIKDRIKELRRVKASELVPNPKNWRTHPTKQKDALKGVLSEIGYADALLARELPDGSLMLLDGHLRAETTPDQEVPVLVLDLTEEEGDKLLATLDPLASLAEQDDEKLAELLESIETENEALQEMLNDLAGEEIEEIFESGENDDSIPEVSETPISKRGDVYQCGNHRLMCGDSTSAEDVAKLMDGEKAEMVFTDPPWNVNYGAVESGNPQGYKPRTILNDFMGTEDFKNFMFQSFKNMKEFTLPGAMIYVVMSAQEWGNMMLVLAQNNFHWSSTIIWNKDRLVLSRKDYHTKYEPIWYGWSDGDARIHPLEDRKQSDVWDIPRPHRSDDHPTMKPVELVVQAVRNSSDSNNLILDLFGGSGTTMIASEATERVCRMMELDPHYCDVIRKRWAEYVHGEGCDWQALTPAI